jgi:hypothetical protein
MNYSYLIIVDAHNKCHEIIKVKSTTNPIEILRDTFLRFGKPILVSDISTNSALQSSRRF